MKLLLAIRKMGRLILLAAITIHITGCATLFSSKSQKVTVESSTPGATINFENKDYAGNAKVKLNKWKVYYAAEAHKDGFKDRSYPFQLHKRSATFAFAILDLVVPFYGWVYGIPIDARSPKTYKFDKVQKIPALIKYENRKEDEKYLLVDNTAIDAKGADIAVRSYYSIHNYDVKSAKGPKHKKHRKDDEEEDINIDNTIFTEALNKTLKKMNFVDTTSIFPTINNTLYVNATIKKMAFHIVHSPYLGKKYTANTKNKYKPNLLLSIELSVNWDVLDYYKQKIDSAVTVEKSDLFIIASNDKKWNQVINRAMNDNMQYALLKLRKQLASKGLLNISNTKQDTQPVLSLTKPAMGAEKRINDFMKSAVTIKVDDGHGSGVIISDDGYIVTNYHVIAGAKKVKVIFNDGTKVDAEIVRRCPAADIVLLKVDKGGLLPLALSQAADPEVGIDVYAIGTPKRIELGQSVSKGVLSGLRKANDVQYLQTDATVNNGNSGGALINKEGVVLGIVTSKLIGVGTEGVGFAISAPEVLKNLNIQYK